MHARILAAVAAVALFGVPASAADLTHSDPDWPRLALPTGKWEGFYLGPHAGYGWGTGDPSAPDVPTQHPDGWFGGGQIGYNLQLPNNLILGAEADFSSSEMDDSALDGNFLKLTSELKYFGTARLRLGYAFGGLLPYVTGGFAWAHAKAGMSCPDGASNFSVCGTTGPFSLSRSSTPTGWTIGGGIEYALADHWSAKIEYLHADFGSDKVSFTLPVVGTVSDNVDQTLDVVRLGINYRFGPR